MKVIVAGHPKTGTKSTTAALKELGYCKVLSFLDHEYFHGKEWDEVYGKGGSVDLFRKMYENVDVVDDRPVFYFWKEIHQAFPDAKIILTMRDEDEWVKSYMRQLHVINSDWLFALAKAISPTGRRVGKTIALRNCVISGMWQLFSWSNIPVNETVLRMKFRQHNADVLHNAPRDKLLVFRVKDGWEPLCKFFDIAKPDSPFPYKNGNSALLEEARQENYVMKKMVLETRVILFVLSIFVSMVLSWYFVF